MEFSFDRLYRLNRRVILWVLFFALIYVLRDFFTLIFLTFISASFLLPISQFLMNRTGMNRIAALSLVYLAVVLGYLALVAWISPHLLSEIGLFQKNLPEIHQKIKDLRLDAIERYPEMRGTMDDFASEAKLDELFETHRAKLEANFPDAAGKVVRFGGTLLFALLFSYLICLDLSRLTLQLTSLKSSRLRDFHEETAQPVVRFAYVVAQAFQAQGVIAVCNTVLTVIGLMILDIPSIAMLALIVFFCSFIPALGVFISTTPMVLIALNSDGVGKAAAVIVFVIVIHAIEAYVLNPLIYGKHLKLNPVFVLIVLYIGHHGFGLWGMLLGVPVTYYVLHDVLGVPVMEERLGGEGRGRGGAEPDSRTSALGSLIRSSADRQVSGDEIRLKPRSEDASRV